MEKILLILSLIVISICSFAQPAQSDAYRSKKYWAVEHGYTINQDKYGYIVKGDYIYESYTFYAGTTYLIYAMSEDDDVTDVDIYLYNTNGSIYIKDSTKDSDAAVVFTPDYNIVLKVVVKNYISYDPYNKSLCRFFIGYK